MPACYPEAREEEGLLYISYSKEYFQKETIFKILCSQLTGCALLSGQSGCSSRGQLKQFDFQKLFCLAFHQNKFCCTDL